jgi:2-C-methyl-D-erythritol 2,4-cyclodiphosphate synthase
MRIGNGHDVHRLVKGRKLVVGGVTIPFDKGLLGHSDADVLVHSVCDALLGAAGLGDIGTHFPDSSPEFKDMKSIRLLARVRHMIVEKGYRIQNVDCTLFAEAPKFFTYRLPMEQNLARAMAIDLERVNIKATTTEGLGMFGRGEGIGAMSTALLE